MCCGKLGIGCRSSSTDEAQRWARAEQLAAGVTASPAETGARRRRRRIVLIVVVIAVLCGVLGVALGVLGGPEPDTDRLALWRRVVSYALLAVGLLVEIFGLVAIVRFRRTVTRYSPSEVLSRRQRRHVLRMVRGQRPARADEIPVARAIAWRVHGQLRLGIANLGLLLALAGQLLVVQARWDTVFTVVAVVFLLLSEVLVLRDAHRARTFLAAHPAPEPG
ncbi:MAG: hypothetical protein ACRDRL_27450 [Sciscionella sp.]